MFYLSNRCLKSLALAGLIPILCTGGVYAAERSSAEITREVMETAIAKVKPALVRIHVVSAYCSDGREMKEESYGSGAIISPDGYVITNHHVAGDAKYITCTMADKEEIEADLIGTDALTDIAVIRLKPDTKRVFPYVSFGDSDKLKVGDQVFAMGSPLAFSQSVTKGVVSNTELVMPSSYGDDSLIIDGEDVGSVMCWIAHDAQIFPGNSGGPLVDLQGQIIGINEVKLGLSGAIPGNLAHEISDKIIKEGKITRSWFGFSVQPLLRTSTEKHGILVSDVLDGSPADKAGFKTGDVVTKIGGIDIDVHYREELALFNQKIMSLTIGKPTEAVVWRDGKTVTLQVTPQERSKKQNKDQELKQWGFCASDMSSFIARELKRNDSSGIMISSLRMGGPADSAKPSLGAGDIIKEIDGKPVASVSDLRKITDELTKGKTEPTSVMVAFDRNNDSYLTVVKIGVQDQEDRGMEIIKAWLPISSQVLTSDLAAALNLTDKTGVRITQVYANTPAEKAGLKVGDVIVALDGTTIEASQPEDTEVLPAMIREYPIGSNVELTVFRDGNEQKIKIELPAAPKPAREMKKYRDENYDFSGRDIAFMDRINEEWDESQTGVIVDSVTDGGWAALGQLRVGDLLYSLNGQTITDVSSLEAVMQKIAEEKPTTVIAQVKRGIHECFLELQASWPKEAR